MMRTILPLTLAASLVGASSGADDTERATFGLTAVDGIKVGHHVLEERPTGCTVVIAEEGAVGAVDVRGGGPGTRETALLDPVATVSVVHAVVLSGGSAFGLDAAGGAVRYLEEHDIGYLTRAGKVPIVPAAILYDLSVGGNPKVRPGAEAGYKAAAVASVGPIAEGSVGAGAGATVGKLRGMERAMRGGLGTASVELPNGLVVAALVAVNSVGDVVDPSTGAVVAGVREEDGTGRADARLLIRGGEGGRRALRGREDRQDDEPQNDGPRGGENTTLGVVATNAKLSKAQAQKIAQMAQDGVARATYPAHTPWDGDTVFALATGTWEGEADAAVVGTVGALAADVVAEAIVRAVRLADSLPGLPSAKDLPGELPTGSEQ